MNKSLDYVKNILQSSKEMQDFLEVSSLCEVVSKQMVLMLSQKIHSNQQHSLERILHITLEMYQQIHNLSLLLVSMHGQRNTMNEVEDDYVVCHGEILECDDKVDKKYGNGSKTYSNITYKTIIYLIYSLQYKT